MIGARGRYYLLLILLCLSIGAWYVYARRFGQGWGDDFAQYLHHALNIATGKPYKQTGHLLNPYYQIGPETYPPVFPLLLAPVVKAVGIWDFATLKLVGIGCFVLALLAWGRWLAKEAEAERLDPVTWPQRLLPLLGLMAVCPTAWDLKDQLISDLPYLLMQSLALLAIQWHRRRESATGWRAAAAAGLLGGALWLPYGCRSIGFTLVGAFALETVWRFRRRPAAARWAGLALALVALLALAQKIYLDSQDAGYTTQLRTFFSAAQMLANVQLYAGLACRYWGEVPGFDPNAYSALGCGVAGLVLLGWYRRWRAGAVLTEELYFIFYALVVVLWPMPQAERFLLPLLPLGVYYGWRGARALPGLWGPHLPAMLAAVLLVVGTASIGRLGPIPWQIEQPEAHQLLEWISWRPAGSVFLVPKPRTVALYAQQPAMQLRTFNDSVMVEQDIAASGARYLVTYPDPAVYHPRDARSATRVGPYYILELPPPALRRR